MQRHHQALRLCAVLRIPGAQLRPHLLVVVLVPVVDALRGLQLVLSSRQRQLSCQRIRKRMSQRDGQEVRHH